MNWMRLGITAVGMLLPPLHVKGDDTVLSETYFLFPLDWLLGVAILLAMLWTLRSRHYKIAVPLATLLIISSSASLFILRWNLNTSDSVSRLLRIACNHILLGFNSYPADLSNTQRWWMDHFPKTETLLWYVAPAMSLVGQALTLLVLIPLIAWFLMRMEYREDAAMNATLSSGDLKPCPPQA